jgi:hypothetical protein
MSSQPTVIERAFAMAESGQYANLRELKAALKKERYSHQALNQLTGTVIRAQLLERIARSRSRLGGGDL